MDPVGDFHTQVPPVLTRMKNAGNGVGAKGLKPGLIVLLVVGGLLMTFLIGNTVLYLYAKKTLPKQKKKPISKKKMKRERLRKSVAAPGE